MSRVSEIRVVGGSLTLPDEFPHQVAIHYDDNYVCAGSILSTLLILTAAHCVSQSSFYHYRIYLYTVIAGLHNITDDNGRQRVRNVKYIYVHERYNRYNLENDIAIMVLSEPLVYSSAIKSVNLPIQNEIFGGYATVSGWGKTSWGGSGSVQLRKADVPIVPLGACQTSYHDKRNIWDRQVCMGDSTRETCQGDSGGAALCKRTDGTTVQCGIVSFGSKCGEGGIPGVYTRVSSYIDWIDGVEKKLIALPRAWKLFNKEQHDGSRELGCIRGTFLCNAGWGCRNYGRYCDILTSCLQYEFRCNNGRCIKLHLTCDGNDDCGDGSDEKCGAKRQRCGGEYSYTCQLGGTCFRPSDQCNNDPICMDLADETHCGIYSYIYTSKLTPSEISSDELYERDLYYCPKEFVYIPFRFRCDGEKDCASGADELDCTSAEITKAKQSTFFSAMPFFGAIGNMIEKGKSRGRTSESGCLKIGTKILMADGSEKEVENLEIGDFALDMDLKPAKILGVNYQYNQKLAFYGFDDTTHFFTNEHMFVGRAISNDENSANMTDIQYYVASLPGLLENNPLMKYWSIKEMAQVNNLNMYHYNNYSKLVEAKPVALHQDPHQYPPETPVYFIQVDSPSRTYFANGYACKVDIHVGGFADSYVRCAFKDAIHVGKYSLHGFCNKKSCRNNPGFSKQNILGNN